jgi:hypothetical protein
VSTIDEIKARIDIVDLVSETVQLRRSGKNYTGFCPFHSNTRTPAFVVFPDRAPGAALGSATRAATSSACDEEGGLGLFRGAALPGG